MSHSSKRDLRELQAIWYKKLEEEGFEDAENLREGAPLLKRWDSIYFQNKYTPEKYEAKQQYFECAQGFYHDFSFPNELEKEIWRLHSEGLSIRESAQALNIKCWVVFRVVKRISAIMLGRANE